MDILTGRIYGTPRTAMAAREFRIKAENVGGKAYATLTITVLP